MSDSPRFGKLPTSRRSQFLALTSEQTAQKKKREREDEIKDSLSHGVVEWPNESAEAPASTDGANLKLQGQSLALTPVASSGWFGGMVITLNTHCHGSTSVPFEVKCRQA